MTPSTYVSKYKIKEFPGKMSVMLGLFDSHDEFQPRSAMMKIEVMSADAKLIYAETHSLTVSITGVKRLECNDFDNYEIDLAVLQYDITIPINRRGENAKAIVNLRTRQGIFQVECCSDN